MPTTPSRPPSERYYTQDSMNVQGLLRELGVDFRVHGESGKVTEGWVGLNCKWCGKAWHLGIHLQTGAVSCWSCGSHNLTEFIAELKGIPYRRARELAAGLGRVRPTDAAPPPGKLVLPAGVGDLQSVHRRYLESRGFDPDELAAVWKLQGIGLSAHLAWRVFIPLHQDGEVVSWTSRACSDDGPHLDRYRGARRDQEKVHRNSIVYGEQHVRHGVIVHEGPADCWATGPGAVCTAGTGFSRGQVRRLARYPVRAVCFDSEPVAQRRARKLADELSVFAGRTEIVQLSGKDAASSPRRELLELRSRYLE